MSNVKERKEHLSHMTVTSDYTTDLAYLSRCSTVDKISSGRKYSDGERRYKQTDVL
jgi:hypothetical protein